MRLKNLIGGLRRRQRRPCRRSPNNLFDDVVDDDQLLCADDLKDNFLWKAQLDAAGFWGRGRLFIGRYRRVPGALQLGAQIVGFEIIAVFPAPLPASPPMQFSLTAPIAAGLLPADLPGVR
jgi:hypothetical protein